jgi:LDH2 family malate/lactate/ureidoglycolate dehydrogenase
MANPQTFPAQKLEAAAAEIFSKCGLADKDSATVARSLVFANLRGVDTHGVARIPAYVERFTQGMVDPKPSMTLESRFGWSMSLDGANGMGAVVGQRAMDEVLARAEVHGIGGATAKRSNHFGAASFFALQAVEKDCVGIVLSPASKSLAPYGSMQPLFGTNPIAVAIPAGRHAPWSMDMATSIAARGHIRLAAKQNKPIPEGWALDGEGRPTTDANAALKGVMLPFSGVKGSAIAMMIDVLGGVLSGSAFGGEIRDMNFDFEAPQDVGHFFMAFKIEAFMPIAEFNARMEEEIVRLKALTPAAGNSEILYPGEPEARTEEKRRKNGIQLPAEIVASLVDTATALGVAFPAPSAS